MHCLIVFPFFLKYLTNAEHMVSTDLLRRNPPRQKHLIPEKQLKLRTI